MRGARVRVGRGRGISLGPATDHRVIGLGRQSADDSITRPATSVAGRGRLVAVG